MSEKLYNVLNEISSLVDSYDFPNHVVDDVRKRLNDSPTNVNYASQQLRYLNKYIEQGKVSKK